MDVSDFHTFAFWFSKSIVLSSEKVCIVSHTENELVYVTRAFPADTMWAVSKRMIYSHVCKQDRTARHEAPTLPANHRATRTGICTVALSH